MMQCELQMFACAQFFMGVCVCVRTSVRVPVNVCVCVCVCAKERDTRTLCATFTVRCRW